MGIKDLNQSPIGTDSQLPFLDSGSGQARRSTVSDLAAAIAPLIPGTGGGGTATPALTLLSAVIYSNAPDRIAFTFSSTLDSTSVGTPIITGKVLAGTTIMGSVVTVAFTVPAGDNDVVIYSLPAGFVTASPSLSSAAVSGQAINTVGVSSLAGLTDLNGYPLVDANAQIGSAIASVQAIATAKQDPLTFTGAGVTVTGTNVVISAGGITQLADATDLATINFVAVNPALSNVIGNKQDVVAPLLLTGATTLTRGSHGNRPLSYSGVDGAILQIANDATGLWSWGDGVPEINVEPGSAGLPILRDPIGNTVTGSKLYAIGASHKSAADTWSLGATNPTIPVTAQPPKVTVTSNATGANVSGTIYTATVTAGYVADIQFKVGSTNVGTPGSGVASVTYTQGSGDTGSVTAVGSNFKYTSNALTAVAIPSPISATVENGAKGNVVITFQATLDAGVTGTATANLGRTVGTPTISGAVLTIPVTAVYAYTDTGIQVTIPAGFVKIGGVGCAAATINVTNNIYVPVTFSVQPASQSALVGATATFTVTASGSGTLTYQWRKGGTNVSVGTGGTTATYTTPTLVSGDNGNVYSCLVTGLAGAVASSNATLTVSAAIANARVARVGDSITAFGNNARSITPTVSRDAAGIVTATATAHGLSNGEKVFLSNALDTTYVREYTVTVVDANTVTLTPLNAVTGAAGTSDKVVGNTMVLLRYANASTRGIFLGVQSANGGTLRQAGNFGQGGQYASGTISSALDTLIARGSTDIILLEAGINDIASGASDTTVWAAIKALIDKCFAANIPVITSAIEPLGSVSNNATLSTNTQSVNSSMSAYMAANPGKGAFADIYSVMVDTPVAGVYNSKSGYQSDGKHPTALGASVKWPVVAAAMSSFVTNTGAQSAYPTSSSDTATFFSRTVVGNVGPWSGTTGTGTAGGTGMSGTKSTSITIVRSSGAGTGVCSMVDRGSSALGFWQQVVFTPTAGSAGVYTFSGTFTGLTAGDLVTFGFDMNCTNNIAAAVTMNGSFNSGTTTTTVLSSDAGTWPDSLTNFNVTSESPIAVPTGSTTVTWSVAITFASSNTGIAHTMQLGRVWLRKGA